ncbi:hypothetical protein IFR04_006060 [Cadophora malorum]|uniref:Uncharacterized protein n=1 Tax=Cadophora malorum TaxID=108018 RepID=A0A8H7TFP7_9HELO|nr:hypothetical protein IFR04_006060 [Cadophora malorum]
MFVPSPMQNYALNRERKAVKENKAIDKQEKADAKLAAEAEAPTHDWMKPDFAGERTARQTEKVDKLAELEKLKIEKDTVMAKLSICIAELKVIDLHLAAGT